MSNFCHHFDKADIQIPVNLTRAVIGKEYFILALKNFHAAKGRQSTVAAEHREPQYFNPAQKLIFKAFYHDNIDYNKWSPFQKQSLHGSVG